jgi:hypothetical protein
MWLAFAWLSPSIGVYSETSEVQIVPHQKMSLKRQFSPPPSHVPRGACDRLLTVATARIFSPVQTGGLSLTHARIFTFAHTHEKSRN